MRYRYFITYFETVTSAISGDVVSTGFGNSDCYTDTPITELSHVRGIEQMLEKKARRQVCLLSWREWPESVAE